MTNTRQREKQAFLAVDQLIKSLAHLDVTEVEGANNGGPANGARAGGKSDNQYFGGDRTTITEQEPTDALAWRDPSEVVTCLTLQRGADKRKSGAASLFATQQQINITTALGVHQDSRCGLP